MPNDRSTAGARVVRGSMWESAALLLPQFYVLVSSAFIARYLGPEGIGRIALIVSVSLVVTTLMMLGLPMATVRFVAVLLGRGQPDAAGALLRWSWRVEAGPAVVAVLILGGIGVAGGEPRSAWVLAGLAAGFAVLHAIPSSYLMGAQRWREARIIGVSTGFVAVVAKVLVVVYGGGVVDLFLVDAVMAGANLIGTSLLARRTRGPMPTIALAPAVRSDVVRFAAVGSIGVVIAFVVGQRIEVLFLGHFATDSEIARYAIPFSLVGALLLIPSAIASAFGPAVSTLWGAREVDRVRSGFSRAMRLVALVAFAITGCAIVSGTRFIELVFGPEFADTRPVLIALVLTLPFVPLGSLSTSLLRGVGRQWGLTIIGAVAAVANIALAFLLVPPYGAVGAAIANTVAQVGYGVPLLVYAMHVIGGIRLRPGDLVRGLVVTAAATVVGVVVERALPLLPALVLGSLAFCVVFVLAAMIVRPLSGDDAAWLEGAIGDRFGRALQAFARNSLARPGGAMENGALP